MEAWGAIRPQLGRTKSASRPPRRVQRFLAERQFITGQAQRLCQDYLAILIEYRRSLAAPNRSHLRAGDFHIYVDVLAVPNKINDTAPTSMAPSSTVGRNPSQLM